MSLRCTFKPDNRTTLLLCELFSQYRAGQETREKLLAIRDELGDEEFRNFEADLAKLMKNRPAWKAVEVIIRAALTRKRDALPGVSSRRVDRKAERMLQDDVRSIED